MGFRFRKSIKIAKGLKINLNKDSISLTTGIRGAHFTINSKGRTTTTIGIPGSGLSFQTRNSIYTNSTNNNAENPEEDVPAFEDREMGDTSKQLKFTRQYIYIYGKPFTQNEVTQMAKIAQTYTVLYLVNSIVLYFGVYICLRLINYLLKTLCQFSISTSLQLIIPLIPAVLCIAIAIYTLINALDLKDTLKLYKKYLQKLKSK